MRTDLRELVTVVLNALPQAAMVVRADGRIVLRNAVAADMLRAGNDVDGTLTDGGGSEVHWAAEMANLAEAAGRLVRRNIRLARHGRRQLVVDLHLRGLPECMALCEDPCDRRTRPGRQGQAGGVGAYPGGPWMGCVLVLVEDVSSRVSMERRLRAGERLAATGVMAAKVAHELNNPLDGVLRFLGLAERVSGPEAGKYLANARAGLMRMAESIRGLLEQGRPWQAGGERVAVQRLLDEAVGAMQPRAQALGVSVVCDFDDRVEGLAEGAVFQVFCNVIKNALDAMPNGGLLTIRLRPAGGQCEVEFGDTGCGLTEQEAERIFEPFYTTKAPAEGSGLGLAICREIVTRLGGAICARPRAEGGAAVAVRLPLRPAWKPNPQEPES